MGKKDKYSHLRVTPAGFFLGVLATIAAIVANNLENAPARPIFKSGQKVTNGICTGLVTRKMTGDEYMIMNAQCGEARFNYMVVPGDQLKAAE
jgi:3-hydroxymyristoyl/3-hydroxydecanoyl-(acyl carrier protein) dehydratase